MSKTAKIEHQLLDSKTATAVALYNEWIKWCGSNGIDGRIIQKIPALFEHPQELGTLSMTYSKEHDDE